MPDVLVICRCTERCRTAHLAARQLGYCGESAAGEAAGVGKAERVEPGAVAVKPGVHVQ